MGRPIVRLCTSCLVSSPRSSGLLVPVGAREGFVCLRFAHEAVIVEGPDSHALKKPMCGGYRGTAYTRMSDTNGAFSEPSASSSESLHGPMANRCAGAPPGKSIGGWVELQYDSLILLPCQRALNACRTYDTLWAEGIELLQRFSDPPETIVSIQVRLSTPFASTDAPSNQSIT